MESGSLNIEVFQERRDGATYEGSVSGVKVVAGKATQVEVPNKPGDGEIVVAVAESSGSDASSQNPNPAMPMVILCRDVGVAAWAAGRFHPEDERLLRILQAAWTRCGVDQDRRASFAGLPAGRYAICVLDAAAEPGKRGSMVVIVGVQEIDLTTGLKAEVRVKLPEPGPATRPGA